MGHAHFVEFVRNFNISSSWIRGIWGPCWEVCHFAWFWFNTILLKKKNPIFTNSETTHAFVSQISYSWPWGNFSSVWSSLLASIWHSLSHGLSVNGDGKILIGNMFFPSFKFPLLTDDDNFQVNCFPRCYFRTCWTSPRIWTLTSSCQVLIPQGLPNVHCLVVPTPADPAVAHASVRGNGPGQWLLLLLKPAPSQPKEH